MCSSGTLYHFACFKSNHVLERLLECLIVKGSFYKLEKINYPIGFFFLFIEFGVGIFSHLILGVNL